MCGGDGLADLVGRRWGASNRLPWNQNKSWAGSLAMLLSERGGAGAGGWLGDRGRARPFFLLLFLRQPRLA